MTQAPIATFENASALYDAGEFMRSREMATELLRTSPDDTRLLRLAGRAGVELGASDAVSQLERAVELEPEDADAWCDLADGLLSEGRTDEAVMSIEKAVDRRPDDPVLLVDLAHVLHSLGRPDSAIGTLERSLALDADNAEAIRGLVMMHWSDGRLEDALAASHELSSRRPQDVGSALDTAELALELDRFDEALDAFRRVRELDDEPDHGIYAVHGLIEAEVRRERWRPALDLAVEATRVDRHGRTTDVLAFIVAQVFGAGDRPAPTRDDVDEALAASRREHRRLHEADGL